MNIDETHPAISDLKTRAKRRIPHFVWEYLDSATGKERQHKRNRDKLDAVLFDTQVLKGAIKHDLTTKILGQEYDLPFGIAPIGMSGLIWPNAERLLAGVATRAKIPYGLSTVATQRPETVAPHLDGNGWFQLYPPVEKSVRLDMLKRVRNAGFETLVLTVDVPILSRRERQRRAQLTIPPRLTLSMMASAAVCPRWSLGTVCTGIPRLRLTEDYLKLSGKVPSNAHAGHVIRGRPDWDYFAELRAEWQGALMVKGVMRGQDAVDLARAGADGIWVSNHGGRQFDGGMSSIEALPLIKTALDAAKLNPAIVFDSGVENGLDIIRAVALGADFVMLGRAFHYGLAAFGVRGAAHVVHILRDDLRTNMAQMGIETLSQARELLISN